MNLSKLIYDGEYTSDREIQNIEIDEITTSVSEITPKSLFVVIRSIKFDVTKIINDVFSRSPAAIICDKGFNFEKSNIPIIYVENTRATLPYLFSRFYEIDFSKLRFCAVTGTNGKTSSATMLTHILRFARKSVGFIGTGKIEINGTRITDMKYSMTTPDPHQLYFSIKQMQNAGCEFVIMEVSSHALYFDKVLPIPYEVALFTNLSPEHMDFHKNMTDYFYTKLKLFSQAKLGIFNMDDEYSSRALSEARCKKISIGVIRDADVMARDVKMMGLDGSEYIYRDSNRLFKVKLNLGGAFNIYNSMMALSAAIALGIKPCVAKDAIEKLGFIDGRIEIIKSDITVIIDYAHTEEAFKNVMKMIKSSKKQEQNVITVFGCGGERDQSKRPKIAKIAEENSDFVIVTSDNPRGENESDIIKDVLSGFDKYEKRAVITSRRAAISHAILAAGAGDIVAIIGKGHERYNIDGNGIHYFDERDVIRESLDKRKRGIYENLSEIQTDTE